jgi:hypothetical protein
MSYSSGCDTFFPPSSSFLALISCLGGDDSDRDQKLGPHEPGNDTEHQNGPRGAEVMLTRELRFLPSNWDFALDVDDQVFLGARAANP